MTDYITIGGVRKRSFTIPVTLPEISDTEIVRVNADDTRVTREGDVRITRNSDTRIAHNTTSIYPRAIGGIKKRSFRINAKVKHG